MDLNDDELEQQQLLQQQEAPETMPPEAALTAPPNDPSAILRSYFADKANQQKVDMGRLASAQEASEANRGMARVGQAFGNLGASIARADKPDQTTWQGLISDADQPVKQLQDQQRLQGSQDKLLRDYLLKQSSLQNATGIARLRADTSTSNAGARIASREGIESDRNDAYRERTGAMSAGVGLRGQRLGLQTDIASKGAANDIHGDKGITTSKQRYESVLRGMHNIDTANMSTAHEILQDYAAALSGQNASSNFKIQSITPHTLDQKIAEYSQYALSNPNQPAPESLKDFLRQQGMRLAQGFQGTIKAQVKAKTQGKKYATPQLQSSVDDAAKYYLEDQYSNELNNQIFQGKPPKWMKGGGHANTKPSQVDQADWDKASDSEKMALAKHFGG